MTRVAFYLGGAFVAVISAWVIIAFLRAEGILDWKFSAFTVGFVAVDLLWRRINRGRA